MNYAQIKQAVASWTMRSDLINPTAFLPGSTGLQPISVFLQLAEQRIYNGSPELGVDQLRLSSMLKTVSPFDGTLPDDCLQISRIKVSLGEGLAESLEFKTIEALTPYQAQTSRPAFYSVQGQQVVYGPTFDTATFPVELTYYGRFQTLFLGELDLGTNTNWLATNAPGVYIYAMCMEVASWLQDDAMLMRAGKLYADACSALLENDRQGQRSGATLTIRTDQGARR